jgi:hypothetical protein
VEIGKKKTKNKKVLVTQGPEQWIYGEACIYNRDG